MIPANRQRNFLQSALYVAIAGVLAAVLLERLLTYAEAAEKAAMEVTISNLQGALYSKFAYHAWAASLRLEALPGEPFAVAGSRSPNYLASSTAPHRSRPLRKWYSTVARELVTAPNLARYFSSVAGEEADRLGCDGLKAGGTISRRCPPPVVPSAGRSVTRFHCI